MRNFFVSLAVALGICNGCSAGDKFTLPPKEFAKVVASDSTAYILDVRHAEEFVEGHIAGAHWLDVLDAQAFDEGIGRIDRNHTVYVYCRSGRRSHAAWQKLIECGFKAYDLEGGILAWMADGLEVSSNCSTR